MLVIALGGCLTTGALADDPGNLPQDPAIVTAQAGDTADQTGPSRAPSAPLRVDDSASEQPQDNQANYYTREDLFAQQRMADATDDLASMTRFQIGIGIFESILLIGTVGLSAWAARAASKAALAANEANKISRENSKSENRAYLTVSNFSVNPVDVDAKGYVTKQRFTIEFKNTGNTPATKVSGAVKISIVPKDRFSSFNWYAGDPEIKSQSFIGRDGVYDNHIDTGYIISMETEQVAAGSVVGFIYGWVEYYTIYGERCIATFRYQRGDYVDSRLADTIFSSPEGNDILIDIPEDEW